MPSGVSHAAPDGGGFGVAAVKSTLAKFGMRAMMLSLEHLYRRSSRSDESLTHAWRPRKSPKPISGRDDISPRSLRRQPSGLNLRRSRWATLGSAGNEIVGPPQRRQRVAAVEDKVANACLRELPLQRGRPAGEPDRSARTA